MSRAAVRCDAKGCPAILALPRRAAAGFVVNLYLLDYGWRLTLGLTYCPGHRGVVLS